MVGIASDQAIELLREAAVCVRDRKIVNARVGADQQWIGLIEAESLVERAERVTCLENVKTFRLIVELARNGGVYRFNA